MKYRKKLIIVDAIQWTGGNFRQIYDFLSGNRLDYDPPVVEGGLVITTAMERMNVNIGDYIIRDVEGVFYPCTQRIFEETYEVFEESEKSEEKVALIMNRPRGCMNCVCLYGGIRYSRFQCKMTDLFIEDSSEVPVWCPLKPLPEKMKVTGLYNGEYFKAGGKPPSYKIGWNNCIDAITGEVK